MQPARELGAYLEAIKPGTDSELVGHALAVAVAWLDVTGVSRKIVEEVIEGSSHSIPSNVGARLLDLAAQGYVTQRVEGREKIWKLTPEGKARFAVSPLVAVVPEEQKFLKVVGPDDFYNSLIDQVNRAFHFGVYSGVAVLSRKLLENLLIDLFRRRYGMKGASLFYDTSRRRFHDFSQVIETLEQKLADFHPISSSFEAGLIRKLEHFRETGNAHAHSIDVLITKQQIESSRAELADLVRLLIRAYEQTPST